MTAACHEIQCNCLPSIEPARYSRLSLPAQCQEDWTKRTLVLVLLLMKILAKKYAVKLTWYTCISSLDMYHLEESFGTDLYLQGLFEVFKLFMWICLSTSISLWLWISRLASSTNIRFFLSLDRYFLSIEEMDSFQHITSSTYPLALDSTQSVESFTLKSTGITEKQNNNNYHFDCWYIMEIMCVVFYFPLS